MKLSFQKFTKNKPKNIFETQNFSNQISDSKHKYINQNNYHS